MSLKLLSFFVFVLANIALTIGGLYVTIYDLLSPQGHLLEGIILTSLGFIMTLIITLTLSIGETITIFGQILEQQAKISKEMNDMLLKKRGLDIDSLVRKISTDSSENDMNELVNHVKLMMGESAIESKEMGIDELEAELARAVKAERFEDAKRIKDEIVKRKNKD